MSKNLLNSLMFMVIIVLLLQSGLTVGQPSGATIVSNTTESAPVASAGALTTAGGTFTTLLINSTTQNPRWKAYVGNITGDLKLSDATSQAIYDWDLSVITGEVYASRSSSVSWTGVTCAARATVVAEDTALNLTTSAVDSINSTFNGTTHRSFFVSSTNITRSSCPAVATYINSSRQATSDAAEFQEVLLESSTDLIYAAIIENDQPGYHENRTFDFQMIVADNQAEATSTTYYFYAELG